jgi:MFS family permease
VFALLHRLTGVPREAQGPVFLVGLGHAATHWLAATFYLLLPFIKHDLGLTYTQAGALGSVFYASSFATNFGSGAVVDVTGRRVLFQVLALLIGAGALLAFGVAGHFLLLSLLVVLIGVSNNLWHPAGIAFLSGHYPSSRGYVLSIHAFGANLGDTVAPLTVGALLGVLSWERTAAIAALPAVLVALLIALMLSARDSGTTGRPHHSAGTGGYFEGLKQIVRDRAVLGLCLMAGFRSMAQNGLLLFLPLYLTNVVHARPLWMGMALAAMQLGGAIAAPIAGTWSDRIGRRPVVLSGLTVTTAVILGLTLVHRDVVLVAAVSVLGFALFAVRPVIHSWMMDITPAHLGGTATSMLFGTQSGLSVLVPMIGGVIADKWGLVSVFYFLAATMLVANVMVYLLSHHQLASARPSETAD